VAYKMIRVKVCGITNAQDAWAAVKLGVDALGFIFAPSPRQVTPEKARSIINTLPPFIQTVGIFVDEDVKPIQEITRFCNLDLIQLHGNEPPEFCHQLMPHVIKAFRLKDETSLLPITHFQGHIRAQLLDTYQQGLRGGTGKTFEWHLAVKAGKMDSPVILSGGLRPSNIEKAVSTVKPYAIDVNSGIEAHPGKKDPTLMARLMQTIHAINKEACLNE